MSPALTDTRSPAHTYTI